MRLWVAATIVMVVAGIVVWVLWSDTTAGMGIALSLVGIASVIAVSLVFFAVGQVRGRRARGGRGAAGAGRGRGTAGRGSAPPAGAGPAAAYAAASAQLAAVTRLIS